MTKLLGAGQTEEHYYLDVDAYDYVDGYGDEYEDEYEDYDQNYDQDDYGDDDSEPDYVYDVAQKNASNTFYTQVYELIYMVEKVMLELKPGERKAIKLDGYSLEFIDAVDSVIRLMKLSDDIFYTKREIQNKELGDYILDFVRVKNK